MTLTAFISHTVRTEMLRARLPEGRFIECHVATSLEACESRDPKGLCVKPLGVIPNFTGVSAPTKHRKPKSSCKRKARASTVRGRSDRKLGSTRLLQVGSSQGLRAFLRETGRAI